MKLIPKLLINLKYSILFYQSLEMWVLANIKLKFPLIIKSNKKLHSTKLQRCKKMYLMGKIRILNRKKQTTVK